VTCAHKQQQAQLMQQLQLDQFLLLAFTVLRIKQVVLQLQQARCSATIGCSVRAMLLMPAPVRCNTSKQ
jgi:hypothetical protein